MRPDSEDVLKNNQQVKDVCSFLYRYGSEMVACSRKQVLRVVVQRQPLPVQPCAGLCRGPLAISALLRARDPTVLLTSGYFPSSDRIVLRIAQILEYRVRTYHLDVEMQWNTRTFEKQLSYRTRLNGSKSAHLHFCETRLRRGICLIPVR